MNYDIKQITIAALWAILPLIYGGNVTAQTIIHEPDGRFGYDTAAHQEVNVLIAKDSACKQDNADLAKEVKTQSVIIEVLNTKIAQDSVKDAKRMETYDLLHTAYTLGVVEVEGLKQQLKDANSNPLWYVFGGSGILIGTVLTILLIHK